MKFPITQRQSRKAHLQCYVSRRCIGILIDWRVKKPRWRVEGSEAATHFARVDRSFVCRSDRPAADIFWMESHPPAGWAAFSFAEKYNRVMKISPSEEYRVK